MRKLDIKVLSEAETEMVAGGTTEYPDNPTDEYWQDEHLAYKTGRGSIFKDPAQ